MLDPLAQAITWGSGDDPFMVARLGFVVLAGAVRVMFHAVILRPDPTGITGL